MVRTSFPEIGAEYMLQSLCERIATTNGAFIATKTIAPPERGMCLARNQLLLSAREAESCEADAEQRESGGLGYYRRTEAYRHRVSVRQGVEVTSRRDAEASEGCAEKRQRSRERGSRRVAVGQDDIYEGKSEKIACRAVCKSKCARTP